MSEYCVYKHTSPSGKSYIGITKQRPSARWKGGQGYKNNLYFYRAIKKYGWRNFTHEILASGLSKGVACELEAKLIEFGRYTDKRYGYNITAGGEVCTVPAETREKIRAHRAGGTAPKRVICLTTGRIYPSIGAAARGTGTDKKSVSMCCRGMPCYNTAGGLRWAYYNEMSEEKYGSF